MSAAPQLSLTACDSYAMQHGFPPSAASVGRANMVTTDLGNSQQYYRYPAGQLPLQHQPPSQSQPQLQQLTVQSNPHQLQLHQLQKQTQVAQSSVKCGSWSAASQRGSLPGHSTQPSTPSSEAAVTGMLSDPAPVSRRGSDTLVYHSLQIPKCVSENGGNLADFAAQMTCLFWFESTEDLKQAQSTRSRSPNVPVPPLPKLAKPHEQFRKWVYNMLSTTQVTQNVVLLALLFIYRLKMYTPQIKGRAGSEYRLLTVALMLGNKFLDDNTYTNRTWADVSCFAVSEIHVMEVEFLSNMRYNLMASQLDWQDWLSKLSSFHNYYERALTVPASSAVIPSPINNPFNSPLPSPTRAMVPQTAEFPLPSTPSATTHLSPSSCRSQNLAAFHANAISPLAAKPGLRIDGSRKRSPEVDLAEHPAKRHVPPRLGHVAAPGLTSRPNAPAEAARLALQPRLFTNSSGNPGLQPQAYSSTFAATSGHGQNLVSLPPLQPGVRAMSAVYPTTSETIVQPPPYVPATVAATSLPPSTIPGGPPVVSHVPMVFGTPVKHQSPACLAPFTSSPLAEFGPASAMPTPISNSPSVYLQQRTSPYRPIRNVNTLLYPPPSASLDQYHLSVPMQPTQMHYQPLGRRNDVRTGVVPEFLLYNHGHKSTPSHAAPHGQY